MTVAALFCSNRSLDRWCLCIPEPYLAGQGRELKGNLKVGGSEPIIKHLDVPITLIQCIWFHHHKDILNWVPNLPTTWRSFPIFAAKLEPHQPVWATGPWWLLWTHHEFLPRTRWTAVLQGAEDAGPVAMKIGLDWRSNTFWLVMAMVNRLYSYSMLYLIFFFRCSCSAGFQPILPCCLPHRINVNSQRRTNLPVPKPVFRGSVSDFRLGVGSQFISFLPFVLGQGTWIPCLHQWLPELYFTLLSTDSHPA